MSLGAAARLAALDLRRDGRRLAGAGVGIALAVAALVFLMALGLGVRSTLLGEVFPLDRLEVAAEGRSLDLLAIQLPLGGDTMDADTVARLAEIPGVRRVFPKMKLTVPVVASGGGWLLGSALQTELVVDGIDPELVRDEVGPAFAFAGQPPERVACRSDRDCGRDGYCTGATATSAGSCRAYLPAIVSPHLLELYNGSIRRAYRMPKLDPERLIGVTAELSFGASMLRPGAASSVVRERARLVGLSDRAIPLGVTLPLGVVRELNARLASPAAASAYHSAILELDSPRRAPGVMAAVESMSLVVSDRGARRTASALALLLAIVAAVGAAVLGVAMISVAHAFFLAVSGRRRELAVLRAIGASRADVRGAVLGEALLVGAVAGGVGVAVAVAAGGLFDRLAERWVPDFPYRPETLFAFEPWLLVGAMAAALLAAALGSLPAVQVAAGPDPSEALTGT